MTKNTKLHKATQGGLSILYRDLTTEELYFLKNIKNDVYRCVYAAKFAIIEPTDTNTMQWPLLVQIGKKAITHSNKVVNDKELFEIVVKEFRKALEEDDASPLSMIAEIVKVFPGQSITDLLKLTNEDLIELVCLAEKIKGAVIFNVGKPFAGKKKKGTKLVDPHSLPDDGKSMQQKIDELNATIGIPRV